jgi:4,5-dihydroxyphthalate decarboxylase
VIDRWGGTQIAGNPRLRKLLEDDGKATVFEYYRRTGFFQAVQNRILREHPWVALELSDAFRRSKEIAYERARRYTSAYLYFPGKDRQEQAGVLGEDPYPLGIRAMGKNVERAIRGSVEQGLLTKPLRLEDIYYRTTPDSRRSEERGVRLEPEQNPAG